MQSFICILFLELMMFTVSLCSKSSLLTLTVRGFSTNIRHGQQLLSLKPNKSTSVLKRFYQTKTNAWRNWEAAEKPKGITGDGT